MFFWEIYDFSRSTHRRCFMKKAVLKVSQYSQESSRPATLPKTDSNTGVFLWILNYFLKILRKQPQSRWAAVSIRGHKGQNSAETRCRDFLVLESRCRGFSALECRCRGFLVLEARCRGRCASTASFLFSLN